MLAIWSLLIGVLGLAIGSFLNVVIHRVPRDLSVVRPPSACGTCETSILPRDNIPVLSWLLLRGRCRHCQAPISRRYPLIELLTALLFAALAARFGVTADLPAYLVLAAVLVAVSAIDLEFKRIPTKIVYPALAATAVYLLLVAAATGDWERVANAVAGLLAGRLPLWLANRISPRGMGFGDVRLATLIGLTLGWSGVGLVAVALFLSFLLSSAVGIVLIAVFHRSRKDAIPFGPFLAMGTGIAVFWGRPVIDWYLSLS